VALGRLTAGATPERAREELLGVSTRLAAEHPDANRGFEASVQPIRDFFPGPTDQKLVMILTAVTLFGLLIACANVANLLLGRAEARQKEVAVRTALGAGRHRILRQLLTESVALAVAAGGVGVLLAVSVVRWLEGMMPAELPRAMIPELDPEVLVATLAVSVLAGIAFGLAPALHAARPDLRGALGDGSRGGTAGRSRKRLRNGFVVGEFAVALALLTGAAFLMQAFAELTRTDPGFRQDGLLTLSLGVSEDRYAEDADVVVYQDALLASLAAVPGVEGVAAMSTLPRGRSHPTASYTIEGREPPDAAEPPTAALQAVNADYFRTLEIDLLRGRGIEPSDRPETLPVAVVSQAFVDRELPAEDPLGRIVTVAGRERTIVGVVEDIIQERIPVAGESGEAIYLPLAQHPRRSLSFALRAAGDPGALAGDVRRAVWAVNPDQPVAQVRTLDDHVAESLTGPRALSWFVSAMGVIALLLAALGIYGVMSHAVQQQRKEIGIRMALGAGRGSVVGMVTRSGLGLAGVGMLLGLPLAWLMYRAVVSALGVFGSRPDPGWAVAVTVALGLVALVSTWLPARRASGVQPVVALGE
jgi:putative ABC transport system permease protein